MAVLVGILGIWQAGGAYVPVELEWPAARQAEMLTDSGVRLVVSQWTVAGQVAPGGWQVLYRPRARWRPGRQPEQRDQDGG